MAISSTPTSGGCHYDLIRLKVKINLAKKKYCKALALIYLEISERENPYQLGPGAFWRMSKLLLSAGQNNSWRSSLNYPMTEKVLCLHSFILNFLNRNPNNSYWLHRNYLDASALRYPIQKHRKKSKLMQT